MDSRLSRLAPCAVLVFVVACSQAEQKPAQELPPAAAAAEPATPEPPPAPAPPPPPSAEDNLKSYDEGFASIFVGGRIDVAKIDQYVVPTVVVHDQPEGQQDLAGWKATIANINNAFSEIKATKLGAWAQGDLVGAHLQFDMRSTGEFNGIKSTGEMVSVRGIEIMRYDQGKIAERWATFDRHGLMQQLGAAPGKPVITPGESERRDAAPDPVANQKLIEGFLTSKAFSGTTPEERSAALSGVIAEDALFHGLDPKSQGLSGFTSRVEDVMTATAEQQPSTVAVLADGDMVIAHWENSMVHSGELMGRKPTGMRLTARGTDLYRIAEGKIVEGWQYMDTAGLVAQLDALTEEAKKPVAEEPAAAAPAAPAAPEPAKPAAEAAQPPAAE